MCASVHVTQGFVNRILGVGTVQISTAGDEPEFTVADMPDPHVIREAIAKAQEMRCRRTERRGDEPMPSAGDRHDRNEALEAVRRRGHRAGAADRDRAAPALYYLTGLGASDPFSAGSG